MVINGLKLNRPTLCASLSIIDFLIIIQFAVILLTTDTCTHQLMLQCDTSLKLCARYVSYGVIAQPEPRGELHTL